MDKLLFKSIKNTAGTKMLSIFLTVVLQIALILSFAFSAKAAPKDTENYDILAGGLTNIENGAYVEGSVRNGGIQPDYYIDINQEPLKSLMASAKEIGKTKATYWEKVGMVVDLVRSDFFKYSDYYNPYYRRLLKQYRDAGLDIPLHTYGVCGAGVCREHALVLHFALKAAGIKNQHAYAHIYRASNWHNYEIYEDHAFTVVKYKGTEWVVDAYYWGFNGFRLKDLLTAEGITKDSPHAEIADPAPGSRKILAINNFPKIFNPKSSPSSCSHVFQ